MMMMMCSSAYRPPYCMPLSDIDNIFASDGSWKVKHSDPLDLQISFAAVASVWLKAHLLFHLFSQNTHLCNTGSTLIN